MDWIEVYRKKQQKYEKPIPESKLQKEEKSWR